MFYVFDCEARLLPKAPASTGLPAAIWFDLLCCGMLRLDNKYMPVKLGLLGDGGSAAEIVSQFAKVAAQCGHGGYALVSFNGRGFDLPLLIATAAAVGVPVPALFKRELEDRYRGDGHIDLMDLLTMRGAGKAPSMDAAAKRFGWPGKGEVDGSNVADLWDSDRAAVERYCLCDVVQEAAIFMRLQVARHWLSVEAFQAAGEALLELCSRDERVSDLAARVDRDRFLLARKA